ncbi:kynurenine--oxoglutarate aminotransferase [Niabella ginsenosidivorans]|uniref:Kynurenine--oxoglutarate aminotransferase n=1 Tax=Niabella ginsenosidivorans TaxID=1176587 RepID=A0A1A9I0C1_9BACT|nr:methionine aminotransferase [Niabella ginsenosidivorans]ANH80132.1 kynurenine--oxoglutarate aminotransferase [Niabella ginsenosidivorans]
MTLKAKHSAAPLNIFTTMSSLAKETQAYNLSQGLPDYPVAPELGTLLQEAVAKGYNQYAPMPGLMELRQSIATYFNRIYQSDYCTEHNITIIPGATYGIFTAFAALLEKGDEVIYLEPAFDCYVPAIEINGGIPVCVRLDEKKNFEVDWQRIQDAITSKTKAILINTPHNPTGRVWQQEDWDQLAGIIGQKDIYVVADEVYNTILFDGHRHIPGYLQEDLQEKIISVYSFGKMHHITGWKIGFCIAGAAITAAFRSVHQYLSFSVNTPAQYALAAYINLPKADNEASLFLQEKRDLLLNGLAGSKFRSRFTTQGSYFQLFDYSTLSPLPDVKFAQWLTINHKVATIPLSAFYKTQPHIPQIRLSFAKNDAVLNAAVKILSDL